MLDRKAWPWIVTAVAIVVLIWCLWDKEYGEDEKAGEDEPMVVPWVRLTECPHYWSRVSTVVGDTVVPLSGVTRDVPEYHDCQRLVAQNGTSYGALAAVFASARIDRLLEDQAARTADYGTPMAVAAATILAIDQPHGDLGIGKGGNCLYLWRIGTTWDARMVPVPDAGASCLIPLDISSTTGTDLDVIELPGAGPPLHPAVARWERSTERGQYVGIRCGQRWCGIGRPGFAPAPDVTPAVDAALDGWLAALPGEALSPVRGADLVALAKVRGWMDDQLLSPAAGGAAPSPLWAAVMPHPRLDAMVPGAFSNWRVAAFVWIPDQGASAAATLAQYKTKYNFGSGWNAIALCDRPSCMPTGVTAPTCVNLPTGEQRWYATIQPQAGGTPRVFCVRRRPHYAGHVIGTARWRWVRNDETVWMRCIEGCCELDN